MSEPYPEPVEPKWNAADPEESFRRYAAFLHEKAKWMFLKDKTHAEMMFLFKRRGQGMLMLVRGDRDQFVARLRKLIRDGDVLGVVHVAEAWTRFGGADDHITRHLLLGETNVSDLLPEHRGEALFVGMQSRGGQVLTWVDPILRDADGKPSFGEGFEITEIGGRYGGLFK